MGSDPTSVGSNAVAYNPDDPTQAAFLASIRSGESGGSNPYQEGYGGVDLSGTSTTDQYGFPQWSGSVTSAGPTHAAGAYQFQPGTFDQIAAQHDLNFQNPSDQDAAAWYLAQQQYAGQSGGASLEGALQSGDYTGVATALQPTWTSLNANSIASAEGNMSGVVGADGSVGSTAPTQTSYTAAQTVGAAGAAAIGMANGYGYTDAPGSSAVSADTTGTAAGTASTTGTPIAVGLLSGTATAVGSWLTSAEDAFGNIVSGNVQGAVNATLSSVGNWASRGFIIIVGVVILGIALWALLTKQNPIVVAGRGVKSATAAAVA